MTRSLGLAAIAIAAVAHIASADSVGYQLSRFDPAPAGDPFFGVESPWYSGTRLFAGGLTLDYAHNVLVTNGGPSPIGSAIGGHLDLAGSIKDQLALTLSVPLVLFESGTAMQGVGPSGTVAGDPRIGARVRLFGQPEHDAFSLSGSAFLWIPVGAESNLAGDAHVRLMARATAAGVIANHARWAASIAYLHRKEALLSPAVSPVNTTVGPEIQIAAGAQYLALDPRLSIGPEANLGIAVGTGLPAGQTRISLEVLLGAHYALTDQLTAGVGIGGGITGAPGPPDARALVSLTYTPRRAHGTFERVIVLPDDEGHVGAVEVREGKKVTLLDKAYASSEVARDGKLKQVQSSAQAMAKRLDQLSHALPPRDRDSDGILDASDACPDRAGIKSDDPLRNGCPQTTEKVVVLPDADGHVGGIEVNDGKSVTVLDKAYASSEVAVDGTAHAVEPSSAKAVEKSVAQLATQLPIGDRDGDGIIDTDDACPDRAGIKATDPLRNGCPEATEKVVVLPDADGHVGGVEVNDGKTVTVLDKAYASSEVAPDGTAHVVPDAPARAVDHSVAQLAKQLPVGDRDGDGIMDGVDACPERAGVASEDPVRNGCPKATERVVVLPDADGHVGGVEVNDGKTVTLLDQPYATAEVGSDGQAHAVAASNPAVVQRSIAIVANTLPRADRDGDGILDKDDACPDRSGPANPIAGRNGCPKALETVIVLPDKDGHVGGVEVNDGKTVTILDKPYATSELGADGVTHQTETQPTLVSQAYAETLAAQPPGARMLIRFNNQAEPAGDTAGPVANLIAETKDRDTYTIDVIGHTDALGTPAANLKLGLARAQVVVDLLIKAGIPADRIHASSKGATEPIVKRPANVAEPLNRRVEVFVR